MHYVYKITLQYLSQLHTNRQLDYLEIHTIRRITRFSPDDGFWASTPKTLAFPHLFESIPSTGPLPASSMPKLQGSVRQTGGTTEANKQFTELSRSNLSRSILARTRALEAPGRGHKGGKRKACKVFWEAQFVTTRRFAILFQGWSKGCGISKLRIGKGKTFSLKIPAVSKASEDFNAVLPLQSFCLSFNESMKRTVV